MTARPSSEQAVEPSSTTAQPCERMLIVDSDRDIARLLSTGLRLAGFEVQTTNNGADATALAAEFRPCLLILETVLPDISGFELCQRIRGDRTDIGVVFLTNRDRPADAVPALRAGMSSYLNKPFSPDEAVARVRTLLQQMTTGGSFRTKEDEIPPARRLRYADLELDDARHEVRRANNPIDLSPTEFALLRYLLQNSEAVVSRSQIVANVWNYNYGGTGAVVETYISYLRKKLNQFGPPLIHTSRGVGYSLRLERK
jgi:two-component system OmpR family response regulator